MPTGNRVNALARDVQRYLADEPVEARPPSFRYRAGKFFRRNKGTVLTAAVVVLLLVGGIIGTTLGMLDAIHQEGIAKKAAAAEYSAKVEADAAKKDALAKLWGAHLNEAKARRFSGRRGQRFESLKAIQAALKLPVPEGRSIDELRNAAIAALCLPDIGDGPEWDTDASPAVADDPAIRRQLEWNRLWARVPEPKHPLRGETMSPDGRLMLCAARPYGSNKGPVVSALLWQLDRPQARLVLKDDTVYEEASAFSSDSKQVALGHKDGTVGVYDTESGDQVCKLKVKSAVFTIRFHPTQQRVAVAAGTEIVIFNLDGAVQHRLPHLGDIHDIAWRPDGRQLAAGCGDTRIYLWDSESGRQATPPWNGNREGGIHLTFNAAGDRIMNTSWEGYIRLWDARTGRELIRFHGHR